MAFSLIKSNFSATKKATDKVEKKTYFKYRHLEAILSLAFNDQLLKGGQKD